MERRDADMTNEREDRASDQSEDKAPGAEPFEGEGGTDTGAPHETTPDLEQDDEDSGTGANNQGAVRRPDQH
jgi:hypothetical protein